MKSDMAGKSGQSVRQAGNATFAVASTGGKALDLPTTSLER